MDELNLASAKSKSDPRIAVLDGIRGLAILLVTLYRFGDIAFPESLVGSLAHRATYLGATGVDLFFVLSGFLITGILLESRHRSGYFKRFYVRRALRIFPLYYTFLFFILILVPVVGNNRIIVEGFRADPIHLWIYTSNLVASWHDAWCYGYLDHFWSLAIEEQFYLMWPIVVFYNPPRRLAKVAWGLLIFFALARTLSSVYHIGAVTEKSLTLFRLDGLLLGAIAAIFVRDVEDIKIYAGRARVAFLVAGVLYVLSLALGSHDYAIRYTLVSFVWVFMLICGLSGALGKLGQSILASRPLRILGKFSYAMYVFQNPLIPLLGFLISPAILTDLFENPLVGGVAYVAIMFGVTFVLAIMSWYCLEMWFLKLRDLKSPLRGEELRSVPEVQRSSSRLSA